ncbi:MAG: carbohydrate-binding protein, partial [Confluentibacter sp.]|nr:carbohydrate-binding protein [Confluentibacter sp.]
HTWCKFHLDPNIKFRESYITYLHYKDNGEMVDDTHFLDKHFATGIGRYDANWDNIEAEWYMGAEKLEKKESPNGGFEIQKVQNNAILFFSNISNLYNKNSIAFYVASTNKGSIEIREKNKKGRILGTCKITDTGGFGFYKIFSCNLDNLKDVQDICLVFKGKSVDILHLDWLKFNTYH